MDKMDQNFMVDAETVKRIVDAAQLKPGETVLEIGAGKGALTRELAKRAKKVIAIEIDPDVAEDVRGRNIRVITGNALDEIGKVHFDAIVSNLPYSICEALMSRLIFADFRIAILTVPKGFAYILLAKDGDEKFSRLSIMSQTFYETEILFDVPKEAFDPRPNVNSVVIKLNPRPDESLEKLVFLQPKKLLKNAIMEAICKRKKMTKSQSRKAIKSFEHNKLLGKKVMQLTTDDWRKTIISLKDYS